MIFCARPTGLAVRTLVGPALPPQRARRWAWSALGAGYAGASVSRLVQQLGPARHVEQALSQPFEPLRVFNGLDRPARRLVGRTEAELALAQDHSPGPVDPT